MLQGSKGLHHAHARKRVHQKLEPYPHPDKPKKQIDKLIYFVAVLGPLMTLPQVLKIYIYQDAAGVSLLSWATYLFCAICWLLYGIAHKEMPIIVSNIIWIVLEIAIVIGILMYGSGLL